MLVIDYNGQVAEIDVVSGEEIIPFGRYDDIQLLHNGFMAVAEGDIWQFKRIEFWGSILKPSGT